MLLSCLAILLGVAVIIFVVFTLGKGQNTGTETCRTRLGVKALPS